MYLEIDEGFVAHRKTLRFCGLMQDHNAFAYLMRMWSWATRSAPDGELGELEPIDIEIAVQYRQQDGLCYAAMVKAGFIDEDEPGRPGRIHNWMKRIGAAIERMERAAKNSKERKRRWNDRRQENAHGTDEERAGNVSGTPAERVPDLNGTPAERERNGPRQDQANQTKASQDKSSLPDPDDGCIPDLEDPDPDACARERSRDPVVVPNHEIAPQFRPRRRVVVAAKTLPYLDVYNAYPRKIGKTEAAQAFQEIAVDYPGGEVALSKAILAAFARGMLKRPPYSGDEAHQPSLETFLIGRRWEDDTGAPAAPPDPYCEFHRQPGSRNKRSFRPLPTCPECNHVAAANRPATDAQPTSASELLRGRQ